MNRYNFNRTGLERKQLVGAISEILNQPINYLGAPTFAYEVGGYHIDKDGTVTGEFDPSLLAELASRGFEPELAPETDAVVIEYPLDGFTPDALDNLTRMVAAKAPLIKMAVGAKMLPIQVDAEKISFPWFATDDPALVACYAQFISQLCKTAREKKRITAKDREGGWSNPRFSFRVFLISLGMVGTEYKAARHALCAHLPGNAAWRYGKPEKAESTTETGVPGDE